MTNNRKRITMYLDEELYEEFKHIMNALNQEDSIHGQSESACARYLISLGIEKYPSNPGKVYK